MIHSYKSLLKENLSVCRIEIQNQKEEKHSHQSSRRGRGLQQNASLLRHMARASRGHLLLEELPHSYCNPAGIHTLASRAEEDLLLGMSVS